MGLGLISLHVAMIEVILRSFSKLADRNASENYFEQSLLHREISIPDQPGPLSVIHYHHGMLSRTSWINAQCQCPIPIKFKLLILMLINGNQYNSTSVFEREFGP